MNPRMEGYPMVTNQNPESNGALQNYTNTHNNNCVCMSSWYL